MICSLDGNIDFFGIDTGVLQKDTLPWYVFTICLDYVFRMLVAQIKEKPVLNLKGEEAHDISQKL